MLKSFGITLLLAYFLLATCHAQTLPERNGIINATLLQNLRSFPHHVGIHVQPNSYCSGSILTPNCIITATTCVSGGTMTLIFNRLNISIDASVIPNSFTITVGQDRVIRHNSANLALIHLPVDLQFDLDIAPIAVALNPEENLIGRLAVMAGIKQNTKLQAYGQFEIVSHEYCSSERVCTLGWRNSSTVPCRSVQGGGLVVDWPWAPRLVGVFSDPQSCLSYIPSGYYKLSHYIGWISENIGKHVNNNGYFF